MPLSELEATYESFAAAKAKFEKQSKAMISGDSSDFELLASLLVDLNAAQQRFSAVATKIVAEQRDA